MHIPDGMLSNVTVAASGVASVGYVGYAVAWVRKHFDQRKVVLMAVTAALIFALQMLNFPVAAGTSGHFAGGALASILLGPFAAAIVMTTVLLVQAVVFADGGILALGANIVNLAIIAPLVGYGIWRLTLNLGSSKTVKATGAFVAAWASLVVSSLVAAAQIWLSGNAQLTLVLTAMGFWHALIGIGEGIITAGLVAYVLQVRPDLLSERPSPRTQSPVKGVAIGFTVLAIVAAGVSFLASGSPDGLEYVYFEQGIGTAFDEFAIVNSPIPDYVLPGIGSDALAGVLAGVVGLIVTGVLVYALLASRRSSGRPDATR
jgi:cobalt/nickel transport system permease protein